VQAWHPEGSPSPASRLPLPVSRFPSPFGTFGRHVKPDRTPPRAWTRRSRSDV